MPFRSNKKVNPGRKKKQQEKSKAEKIERLRQRLLEKEIARRKEQERLDFLRGLYQPGKLYRTKYRKTLMVQHRDIYLDIGTMVFFIEFSKNPHTITNLYNFKLIVGEELGTMLLTFQEASDALNLVEIPEDPE